MAVKKNVVNANVEAEEETLPRQAPEGEAVQGERAVPVRLHVGHQSYGECAGRKPGGVADRPDPDGCQNFSNFGAKIIHKSPA